MTGERGSGEGGVGHGSIRIYGLRRSGRGVARFLAAEGMRAQWHDARPSAENLALMAELHDERGDLDGAYETVVAAPTCPSTTQTWKAYASTVRRSLARWRWPPARLRPNAHHGRDRHGRQGRNHGADRLVPARLVLSNGKQVLPASELPDSIHLANAAALLAAQPQRGHFETVARLGGVRFIDDSIATRTIAVQAALERATPPIAWLMGGRDKGAELGLPFVAISGADGDGSMRAAAMTGLEALNGSGTVVLAPVGTSFDQFRDYAVCGDSFRRAGRALTGAAEVEA